MILTRDKDKYGFIILWPDKSNKGLQMDEKGEWLCNTDSLWDSSSYIMLDSIEFKKIFCDRDGNSLKLPRKGTKKYISHLHIVES